MVIVLRIDDIYMSDKEYALDFTDTEYHYFTVALPNRLKASLELQLDELSEEEWRPIMTISMNI